MVEALEGYGKKTDNQSGKKWLSQHCSVPVKQQGRTHPPKQMKTNEKHSL